ncbi:MAG: serine hydrolase [Pseudomonadales bacterium]|jgi:CubicO group peptidase (beta-lactamase class C family)|nr:serine hydrolase [Pseudomonadales bacterium]
MKRIPALLFASMLVSKVVAAAPAPVDGSLLTWRGEQQLNAYRSMAELAPTRPLEAGAAHFGFVEAPEDLDAVRFPVAGEPMDIASYMARDRVAGLIAVRDGEVRFERYGLGNDRRSRWISFSVAKSVSSMMLGAAIQDGYIRSVDDPVTDYLPQLRGTAYGRTRIRDVLHMSSGVGWNEDYADPASDVSRAGGLNALALYAYLDALPATNAPGAVFNYNTGETNLIGGILRAAVGDNLAHYTSRKLWRPFMESDATWMADGAYEVELGGCCINATLRDYARIGQFALDDGVLPDGTRVLPEGWMKASTTPSPAYDGYGYQWWLLPDGNFAALGIFGQMIWISPATRTIIAAHGAWPTAVGETLEASQFAMARAIDEALTP